MLDLETRRRIDNARDILVGKVPDPKSQVEQITIALIYKFMDDMDNETKELGGKASFFKGEFSKYSWSNIFDPKLGGHELINLYGEAITKMNQNKYIPQLFRDIFKNAFLPYRDPETLKSFLKEINDFHYDHSERLGDAFEYLLSVLGVQGDAGSLRTPRHIIDFIVEVIDPKKNETILDPACGTAGFLISSYKHILAQNTDKKNGDRLTPDDRKRLIGNIVGYDISPDMMRLSLVNLYLHGFQNPKIYEYDSLTSDDRWNDTFDIILANPPFMTPKGGIRPHKRFQIQANRSEVLFVDYIMEHIATDGRAGVIVPEGIIFQSGNAYKLLRKTLVENNYLYAIVSLPAGVFNPYSGVKTSILLMDRTLAKKTKDILFIKIENDGFDLGAQRREIDKNDLPNALSILQKYKQSLIEGRNFILSKKEKELAHAVSKAKIAESGDFNLTGDRYRERIAHSHKDWPMVELEEIFEDVKYTNKIQKSAFLKTGRYPIIDQSENFIAGYWDDEDDVFKINKPVVIFGDHTRNFKYIDFAFVLGADGVKILQPNKNVNSKYLYYILKSLEIKNLGYSRHFKELKNKKIPLPPFSVQQEIVAEIEGYQKIIDGAKQIVENYKPKIKVDENWKVVELGEICELTYGYTATAQNKGKTRFIRITDIDENGRLKMNDCKFINISNESKPYILNKGDLVVARTGATYGKTLYFEDDIESVFASYLIKLNFDTTRVVNKYYWIFTQSEDYQKQKKTLVQGGGQPQFNANVIVRIQIPLPPLKIQKQIVAQIEEEQKLVEANKKLIEIFEGKIKAKIAEVWG
jgi:type I restriction enzyme M protein